MGAPKKKTGRWSIGSRGVTLIEVILVVIILGVVGAVFGGTFVSSMKTTVMVDTRKEALQSARMALARMSREIRLIRSATAADIPTFTATNLQFIDNYASPIQFQLVGTNLNRNTDVLASNVTTLTFTYLKKNGAPVVVPPDSVADIWRIGIDLTVTVAGEAVRLRTEVHPTNL